MDVAQFSASRPVAIDAGISIALSSFVIIFVALRKQLVLTLTRLSLRRK